MDKEVVAALQGTLAILTELVDIEKKKLEKMEVMNRHLNNIAAR